MSPIAPQANDEAILSLVKPFGLLQVASLLNALIFGINCVRAFDCIRQPRENASKRVKSVIVALVWLINALRVVFSCISLVHYSPGGLLQAERLLSCHWSLSAQTLLAIFGNSIIRGYFIWRFDRFLKGGNAFKTPDATRIVIMTIAVLLCVSSFALGLVLSAEQFIHHSFAEFAKRPQIVYLPLVFACLTDSYGCSCLCFVVCKIYRDTKSIGPQHSHDLLKRFSTYHAIDCFILTCANITCIVTFTLFKNRPVYLAVLTTTSSYYFLSLLTTAGGGNRDEGAEHRSIRTTSSPSAPHLLFPLPTFPFRSPSSPSAPRPPSITSRWRKHLRVGSKDSDVILKGISVNIDRITKVEGEEPRSDSGCDLWK